MCQRKGDRAAQADIARAAIGILRQDRLQREGSARRERVAGIGQGPILMEDRQVIGPIRDGVVVIAAEGRRDRIEAGALANQVGHLGHTSRVRVHRLGPGADRKGDRLTRHRATGVSQRSAQFDAVAVLAAGRIDQQRGRRLHRYRYGISHVEIVGHQADGHPVGLARQVDAADAHRAVHLNVGFLRIHQRAAQRPHLKPYPASQGNIARTGVALLGDGGAQSERAATRRGRAGVGQGRLLTVDSQGRIRRVGRIVSVADEGSYDRIGASLQVGRVADRHVAESVSSPVDRCSAIDREGHGLASHRGAEAGLQRRVIAVLHVHGQGGQGHRRPYLLADCRRRIVVVGEQAHLNRIRGIRQVDAADRDRAVSLNEGVLSVGHRTAEVSDHKPNLAGLS